MEVLHDILDLDGGLEKSLLGHILHDGNKFTAVISEDLGILI